MRNNYSGSIWFHIPIILIKIVRILTKKPSGQPKKIKLKLWGRSIEVATDPGLGRVRLEIITSPLSSLENKKSKLEEGYQPKLDLGGEG
jgi:hypothetical protein